MIDYKLLSYQAGDLARCGILVEGRVHDLAALTAKDTDGTVLGVLEDWDAARARIGEAASRAGEHPGAGRPRESIRLLAPVLFPGAIYCAGANYSDHVQEMARAAGRTPGPDPKAAGLQPWHFLKPSRVVAGDNETVRLPAASAAVDWEVELVAVIGRRARDVAVEDALGYVAGYTIANDLSARDLAKRPPLPETSPMFYDWLAHKGFDGGCPLGPWITPSHAIVDPQDLKLGLSVNGRAMQDSHTGRMIFSVAEQVAHLSSLRTLYPGDLVLTGTPSGVGAARGEFLKPGDVVEAWIDGVGSLRTPIAGHKDRLGGAGGPVSPKAGPAAV